jgi:SAM-dependent methyltransferase
MGLNINATKLLLKLKSEGFDYGTVLTLGRQRLNVTKGGLQKNLKAFGYNDHASELKKRNNGYCEPFLQLLGAEKVDSMDVSDYEKATLLHDLNNPIDEQHKGTYQTVIDSGTLEHVFNFPVAIKNCMELIQPGGHYIGITPCNNFFGHGFYQFSPELYYRVFSKENGFQVKKMYFFIDDKGTSFYEVKDPAEVKERVILTNAYPAFLFVVAEKTSNEPVFRNTPQQSDYENIIWKKQKMSKKLEKFVPKPLRKLPRPLKKLQEAISLIGRQAGTADSRFFKKIF